MDLKITLESEDLAPTRAHDTDAGLDLRVKETVQIKPFTTHMVGTGVRAAIPKGYYGEVVMRSGFASKTNIVLANGTGIIDSDYRGEIMLPLFMCKDAGAVTIPYGSRVAQLIIHKIPDIEVKVVDHLDETSRGDGGFGSSGRD